MNFVKNSNRDSHATFSASKYSWLRYDQDKMVESILSQYRKAIGTEIHDYASKEIDLEHKKTSGKSIKEGIESYIYEKYYDNNYCDVNIYGKRLLKFVRYYLPKEVYETVKCYINDAIAFKMSTEIKLEFNELFHGTADAISFNKKQLRIHDLKTGSTPANIEQLMIYAAFFCLMYKYKPETIDIELRLYQNAEVLYHIPDPKIIADIMEKIIADNKYFEDIAIMEV